MPVLKFRICSEERQARAEREFLVQTLHVYLEQNDTLDPELLQNIRRVEKIETWAHYHISRKNRPARA